MSKTNNQEVKKNMKKKSENISKEEKPKEIRIDAVDIGIQAAVTLKILEFDKGIAEAESVVSEIKKQKAIYLFNTNLEQAMMITEKKKIEREIKKSAKLKMEKL